MSDYKCVKCEGAMKAGYVPDFSHGRILAPNWYSGEPENAWLGGISVRKKTGMPITTYRCESCGYLESFAWPARE